MICPRTRFCLASACAAFLIALALAFLPARQAFALGGAGAPEINPALLIHDLYVNPVTGNDTNSGNATAPFRTLTRGIQRAQQLNALNQGVTVHLAPGTYLEGAPGQKTALFMGASTAAPIVIQGQGWSPGVNTGDVIITGSEVWSGWQNDGDGVWSKPWPYQMPIEPGASFGDPDETIVPEVVRLMSGLFVNGEPYYIFRSATDPDLSRRAPEEGAYWIDLGPDGERGGGDDRVCVRVPSATPGLDLNAQTVRVTTRGNLIHFWRPGTSAGQPTNIAFRNLVFEHSGGSALIVQNHGGLIVEDVVFRNNKWRGTTIESIPGPATVRRCIYTGNGEQTIATRGRGMLYEDLLIHNNSRQSFLVRYLGWSVGAFKIGESSDTTFRRIRSINNWGVGAWFDTGNVRCEIVDSVIAFNKRTAVFVENNNSWNIPGLGSETTVEVRNCLIANNNRAPTESAITPGVQIGESQNVSIRDNVIAGNDLQVRILGITDRGPQSNVQFFNNTIASVNATQSLFGVQFGITAWRTWFDSLTAATDWNSYSHPTAAAFLDRDANSAAPLNFAQWKTAHLNNPFNSAANKAVDGNSTFTNSAYTLRPLVSIAPVTLYISENAGAVPAFRVFRLSHDLSASMTVTYTIRNEEGDAIPGADYAELPGSITIPAGELYADIWISPVAGDATEPLEPIEITLIPNPAAFQLGRSDAQIFLDDEAGSLPSVSITASHPTVAENGGATGQYAEFTFARTGVPTNSLTVNFTITGTATPGSDYTPISTSVTFPAGVSQVTLPIFALDNALPEPSETITLTLQPQSGVYAVAPGVGSATVTILDDDILSLHAIVESVPSGGGSVTVPVTIFNPSGSSVNFTISPQETAYSWGASSLNTAPAFDWVEIINHPDPGQNGTLLPGPGTFTGNASDYLQGAFTWMTYAAAGYSGGWLRNPLPNNTANATRSSDTLALGFSFPFFNQTLSAVHLHTNGFLATVPDPQGFVWSSGASRVVPARWFHQSRGLPSSDEAVYPTPRGAIAPFWGHLTYIPGTSQIAYKAFPDRFVITWQDMGFGDDVAPFANRFTFQAILYPSGDMDFQYLRADRPTAFPNVPTTGLTSSDLSKSLLISYEDGLITPNLRIRVKRHPGWASASVQTVTIPAGGSATVNITLTPDNLADGIYTMNIPITSGSGLIPQQTLPVTFGVGNVPGALSFTQPGAVVNEDAESLILTVQRTLGSTGNVSVSYRITTGGTATPDADFLPQTGTLTWSNGDTAPKSLTIPILDDLDPEGDETFLVELHTPTGNATLGSPSLFTVTIRDNDLPVGSALVLSASPVSCSQINLTWTSVANAAAFRLERSADGGATWQIVAPAIPGSTFAFADTALLPNTTYAYRIRAFNTISQTEWAGAGATTLPPSDLVLTFPASAFYENTGNFTATVTRTGSDVLPATVRLTSHSVRVHVPESVVIPAGQSSANFTVTLLNDTAPQPEDVQVVITASVAGAFTYESFSYTSDSVLHNASSGRGWTSNWVDTYDPPRFVVRSGGLNYPGWGGTDGYIESLPVGGASNAWRDLAQPINSGVFYVGVLMQLQPGAPNTSLFFGLGDGYHTDARNWMFPLRFQLDSGGNLTYHNGAFPTVWTPTGLVTASGNNRDVNLLVVKVNYGANNAPGGGDDSFTVWLNPALDGSGTEPPGGVTIPVNLYKVVRISPSGGWNGCRYDEIRVGSSFSDLFQPALSGQGQFTLRDDDSLSGLRAWRNQEFGSPQETGDADPLADPDSDDLPNLLEYALATAPLAVAPAPIAAGSAEDFLTLTFTHRHPLTDAVIEVQGTSNLADWETLWSSAAPASPLRISFTNHGNGTATTTVRDTVSLSLVPHRHLRLRVIDGNGASADSAAFAASANGTPFLQIAAGSSEIPQQSTHPVPGATAGIASELLYTLHNSGSAPLAVGAPAISSATNCEVALTAPSLPQLSPGSNSTLSLSVTPAGFGPWSFVVSLPNTDPARHPFTWTVSGIALPPEAATLQWCPGGLTDASGTWNHTHPNWLVSPHFTPWPNRSTPPDIAQFGNVTTTRTVTLEGALRVGSLVFSSLRNGWGTDWVLSGPGSLELTGPALINPVNGENAVRIDARITGSAGLTLNSTGTRATAAETRLAGENTYTGVTRITGSTLRAMHNSALGATGSGNHTEIFTGGRLLLAGATPLNIPEDIILKPGASDSAIRASEGNHTLTGTITTEQFDAGFHVNTANASLTLTGSLAAAPIGGPTLNRRFSLTPSAPGSRIIISGSITDATDGTRTRLVIIGNGSATQSGTVELRGANTFTRDVTIRSGTLILASTAAANSVEAFHLADGGLGNSLSTLRLLTNGTVTITRPVNFQQAAGTNTYYGIVGGGSPHVSTFNATVTINDANPSTYAVTAAEGGTVIFQGLITDGAFSKSLSKIGPGTVVFARAAGNTFDGGLVINEGTALATNTSGSATGTGPVAVASGARLGGTGIVSGPVQIATGGGLTFHLTTPPALHDRLDLGSSLTFAPGTVLEINATSAAETGSYVLLQAAGGITGPLPAISLPTDWSASLSVSGNQLVLTVTATQRPPLQVWRDLHFGTALPEGPAADTADPDGDGVPNLIEFALGGTPTDPASRPLPTLGTTTVSGEPRLTLNFTPQQVTGLRYVVQASTDLSDWADQSDLTDQLVVGQPFTFTDSADLATTPRRFLRLRVTIEP